MAKNQNISQFKEYIQNLIACDQVQKAINELIPWIKDYTTRKGPLYEILVISSNYRRLEKQFNQGLMPFSDYQMNINKLLYQIFRLIEDIASDGTTFSIAIPDHNVQTGKPNS